MPALKTVIFSLLALCLVSSVWTCQCYWQHPQEHYCSSDIVVAVFVHSTRKVIMENGTWRPFREQSQTIRRTQYNSYPYNSHKGGIGYAANETQHIPADNIFDGQYEFKIYIIKSYKGGLRYHSYYKLYSSSSSSCGTFLKSRRYYYITANRGGDDGRLRISVCDYQLDVTLLSAVKSRYIKENFAVNYENGCQSDCRISIYIRGGEEQFCSVPDGFSYSDETTETYCVRSEDNICTLKYNKDTAVSLSPAGRPTIRLRLRRICYYAYL